MKKIFLFLALFSAVQSMAQNRLYGLGSYNINSQKWVWFGAGGTDTVGVIDSLHVRFKKPVIPGSYSTATAPPASAFTGYIIWNTDSTKHQYSNGTNWLNLPGTGGGGGGGSYVFNSPLSEAAGSVSIANAAADGSTKGAASFNANDFDASSGNISIDYANGQAASASVNGFMITGAQTIAGAKTWSGNAVFNGTAQFNGAAQVGGTSNGTLNIANSSNSVRGAIDLSSNNPRFNSATGVILFAVAGNTIATGHANGWFLGGATVPATATVDILAGTTARPPLRLNSGPLATTAVAGGVEFLTDKFYGTISTGAARKEFAINDNALTSGRVVTTTTNGRLTDLAPGTDGHVLTLASGVPTWAAPSGGATTIYNGDGTLAGNRAISGDSKSLSLGTSGSKLSSFQINSSGNISINGDGLAQIAAPDIRLLGTIRIQFLLATDADVASIDGYGGVILPEITSGHSLNLPSPGATNIVFYVINENTSGNSWGISGGTLEDKDGTSITTLANETNYLLRYTGSGVWRVILKY